MENYTIKIPCKRYIKNYYTSLYGDVIKPDFKTDFGDTILTKLSAKPLNRLSNQDKNIFLKGLTSKISFRLPIDFFYRVENNITDQQIYSLNRYLENTFDSELFIFINIAAAFGVMRKDAFAAFCNRYNIQMNDEITIEGLQKKESRTRAQKKSSHDFLVGLSDKYLIYFQGAGFKA